MTNLGQVYFITDGEAIKIGFATNLTKRIRQMQTSCHFPLFLLGSIVGTMDDEKTIHRKFQHLRLTGEWFKIDRSICQFIDEFEDRGLLLEGDCMSEYETRF